MKKILLSGFHMKLFRLNLAFIFALSTINVTYSQNTYDNYGDFSGGAPAFNYLYSGSSYAGEYQIHLRTNSMDDYYNNWPMFATVNLSPPDPGKELSISYKIETVSFPFAPKHSTPLDPLQRTLNVLDNTIYNSVTNQWESRINRIYEGVYNALGGVPISCVSINGESTLISAEYRTGYNSTDPLRIIYPHSILKHTIYVHCGLSASSPPIDSIVFVIDHTRGRMRHYPFFDSNYTSGSIPPRYDLLLTANYFYGNDPGNGNEFWNPNNPQSTINYIPNLNNDGRYCNASLASSIHPGPYSLASFQMLNSLGNLPAGYGPSLETGIKHAYVIDKPVDLTIINPSEKIIYNPSEVELDLNNPDNTTGNYTQIFPAGYTFKTVSGRYPTDLEVYNADPNGLYIHKDQVPVPTTLSYDDVGNPSDNIFSYYYVKSGTTLKIEACVSIYDTKIIVEPGGKLIYDFDKTYGNFTIQNNGIVSNVFYPPIASCVAECYQLDSYDDFFGPTIISSDQTWNGAFSPFDYDGDGIIRIAGTLRIAAGYTLTINDGLLFEFGETGRIVVERGAKLIVDADASNPCRFTSAEFCKEGMWYGIEVWGDRTKIQTDVSQGVVKLTNVKLSNARDGIITSNGSNSWDYAGGVIQCQNVEFINNRRAVGFSSYPSTDNNLSYFKSCSFFTTSYLNDPTYLTSDGRRHAGGGQVTMWDVKNVGFRNCYFENKAKKADGITPLFDTDTRSMGIFAIDADIQLLGDMYDRNSFTGYSDAIWCINTTPNTFQWIGGNVFENNVHSITIEGGRYSLIEENRIQIPAHEENMAIDGKPLMQGYNKPTGIYMIGVQDFTIDENALTNYGTPSFAGIPVTEYNYGIVVNNCAGSTDPLAMDGTGTGYVFKNDISNVNIGMQSELDNRGVIGSGYGLQYSCNNFTSRITTDVAVVSKSFSEPALLREQGLCDIPENLAGNTYVYSGSCSGYEQLEFDATALYYETSPNFLYSDRGLTPYLQSTCTNMPTIGCSPTIATNPCLDIARNCDIPCWLANYNSAVLAAKDIVNEYTLLVDGGNTDFLLQTINSSMPAGQLKDLLISKSPYLSDEVLIATLNRNDHLPFGHLEQIIIANSPVTVPVMTAIENIDLPNGIMSNIQNAQTGISARREKEIAIDYYAFMENLAETRLVHAYLKVNDRDNLKILAEEDATLNGLYKLLEVLIAKEDYAAAQTCLSNIINNETPYITDRCKLNSIRLNLTMNGKSWPDMDNTEFTTIGQIYDNNPLNAIYARSILAVTRGLQYDRYPYDLQTERSMAMENVEAPDETSVKTGMKIYPNPSSEFAMVEFDLKNQYAKAELIIYNLLGEEIQIQEVFNINVLRIDTKHFTNGIYLFVLRTENGIVEQQKIIISR